jgi:hypothetical protein
MVVTTAAQNAPSARAKELADRVAAAVETYRHAHPKTTSGEVRYALQSAMPPSRRGEKRVPYLALLLAALGAALGIAVALAAGAFTAAAIGVLVAALSVGLVAGLGLAVGTHR